MLLKDLVQALSIQNSSNLKPDLNILALSNQTQNILPGTLFIAVRGSKLDGHNFIPQALAAGAVALIVEDIQKVPSSFKGPVLEVKSSRISQAELADYFYQHPSQNLFCVGVTGTNGKTSVTYMVEALLGKTTAVVGTIDHHLGTKKWPTQLTTPDVISLHHRLSEFVAAGANSLAMEVSSHALEQGRAAKVEFDVGVFTNLSRDHLDYHGSMESYFAAKEKLFTELLWQSKKAKKLAIINEDDPWVKKTQIPQGVTKWSFAQMSSDSKQDLQFKILEQTLQATRFLLKTPKGDEEFELPLPGKHNVQNAVAALAVALWRGKTLQELKVALKNFAGVPGRLELVNPNQDFSVFVDYAHTPDALKKALSTLQESKASQVGVVFGCGGDRDSGKRPQMAKVTEELADWIIVTSDNPRSEDPQKIIKEISAGFSSEALNTKVQFQVDRKLAIEMALKRAKPGEAILIAGKGHENYQEINGQRFTFSDQEVVKDMQKKV